MLALRPQVLLPGTVVLMSSGAFQRRKKSVLACNPQGSSISSAVKNAVLGMNSPPSYLFGSGAWIHDQTPWQVTQNHDEAKLHLIFVKSHFRVLFFGFPCKKVTFIQVDEIVNVHFGQNKRDDGDVVFWGWIPDFS